VAWLHSAVKTPPFSSAARLETGFLLRRLQRGESLSMPILARCRALAHDAMNCESMTAVLNGRLVYRIDTDAIVILEVFAKKTGATPKAVIAKCRERLKEYENAGK
jgi:phage-related protein